MTWDPDWGLSDRGVIVTGAAGGIGRSVASGFAAVGARVLAVDMDAPTLGGVVSSLPGAGHRALAVDLADIGTHGSVIDAAREAGDLWALVHLAAVLRRRPSADAISIEDWDTQLDVNLRASFFLCRSVAQAMAAAGGGGRIVTFASNAAWTGGLEGSLAYAASKGGVVSLTRGLARSYARHGVTVNAVAPGEVDTPMYWDGLAPAAHEAMLQQIPLGRLADPDEIAGAAIFLASRHASYLTGAALNLTGGFQMF
jgi:NAD(P)-dependent dehydrogenase (short-subunit alcohol dehydrogenase family)